MRMFYAVMMMTRKPNQTKNKTTTNQLIGEFICSSFILCVRMRFPFLHKECFHLFIFLKIFLFLESVHMNFRSEMNFGWAHGMCAALVSLSNLIYFNKIFNQIGRVSVRAVPCRATVLVQLMNWILWILRSRRHHSWFVTEYTEWSF